MFCVYICREREREFNVDHSFKQCFFVKTIDFRSHIKLGLFAVLFCSVPLAYCCCCCWAVTLNISPCVLLILGPGNFCLVFLRSSTLDLDTVCRASRAPSIYIHFTSFFVTLLFISFSFRENRFYFAQDVSSSYFSLSSCGLPFSIPSPMP